MPNATHGITSKGEPAALPESTTAAPAAVGKDQQQQKAALSAWEDEGGRTAALPNVR
jgi:hypothetical protein